MSNSFGRNVLKIVKLSLGYELIFLINCSYYYQYILKHTMRRNTHRYNYTYN